MINPQDKAYSLKEAADILGISYNYLVNKVTKTGELKTINIGTQEKPILRLTQQSIDEYRSRHTAGEQNTIKNAVAELQTIRNSVIISYLTTTSNLIEPVDALYFSDVIEDIKTKKNIQGKIPILDIFINSFGGSLDAAYKIARILWQYADKVNAIVPINAKSAATAICIGTREITMTPVSELGPVDPIIEDPVTKNKIPAKSIKIFLSYQSDLSRLKVDKIDPQIIGQLGNKLDPLLAGAYFNAINTSKEYLRILLNDYMFSKIKTEEEIEKIVENLTETHYSHAFVIDNQESQKIGLNTRMATSEEDKAIKKLMIFYNQFMNAQGITKLVGNEFWQIQQGKRG